MAGSSERQAMIAERVRQFGFQSINELADHFDVTTQTIRRDLVDLCDAGILKRRHGAVELPTPQANLEFKTRQALNADAKNAIARHVAQRIPDGATLAVSIGTTPEIVVRHLAKHRNLIIYTNNLMVALVACDFEGVEVFVPGGRMRLPSRDIVGLEVDAFFRRYKVDFGIYGVGGVDAHGTLLDFHESEIAVREAIRDNCRASFLVLDASKFRRRAHVRGGQITDPDVVFCDEQAPEEIAKRLSSSSASFVVCK